MARLGLLIVLAIVAAFYFPDSRRMIIDMSGPVVNPVFRWQTTGEIDQIIRDLRSYESEHFDQLPDRREWGSWLEQSYHGPAGMDGWGTRYHFMTQRDSFYVVSYGPDRVYGTEDDVRRGGVRADSRR